MNKSLNSNILLYNHDSTMNKAIAIITAGILAAEIMVIASSTGSTWASTSASNFNAGGLGNPQLQSQAAANPGQTASAAGGSFNGGYPLLGTASAASEDGTAGAAAGQSVACGNGANASVGACAQATSK